MKSNENKSAETIAVASLRAMLVQAQGLDIMMQPLAPAIGNSDIGGEMCEVIEEIANVYLDLSEKIAATRAKQSQVVEFARRSIAGCA